MNLLLAKSECYLQNTILVSGSKSETNRLLLLQALYPNLVLENVSNSDDSQVMIKALASKPTTQNLKPNTQIIDIHHAGTAMRFLTAYFAMQEDSEVILTGSSRMKERPIKILVESLQQLGAAIEYVEKEGFPPVKITGKKIIKNAVSLSANVSSQYISALLLIASKLENGIILTLEGEITSIPYINMTLALLKDLEIETSFIENVITVSPKTQNPTSKTQIIESDWSSASYFYSIIALSKIGTQITLSSYKPNSLQGDAVLSEIYQDFGVETTFDNNNIIIKKSKTHNPQSTTYNLNNAPDIAQTIAVTCFGLGIGCDLTGLHTLKIKETDRLEALQSELSKLGAVISVTNDSLTLEKSSSNFVMASNVAISTYQDHRMAMAFAPLALKTTLIIQDAEVVSKSYPLFWEDLKKVGFNIIAE